MSEIANAYTPDFSPGMSIRRFLSTLKNHRLSGSISRHATCFSRWFLTHDMTKKNVFQRALEENFLKMCSSYEYMPDSQLIAYIQAQRAAGYSVEQIRSALLSQGHEAAIVEEALSSVNTQPAPPLSGTATSLKSPLILIISGIVVISIGIALFFLFLRGGFEKSSVLPIQKIADTAEKPIDIADQLSALPLHSVCAGIIADAKPKNPVPLQGSCNTVIDTPGKYILQNDIVCLKEEDTGINITASGVTLDCNGHIIEGTLVKTVTPPSYSYGGTTPIPIYPHAGIIILAPGKPSTDVSIVGCTIKKFRTSVSSWAEFDLLKGRLTAVRFAAETLTLIGNTLISPAMGAASPDAFAFSTGEEIHFITNKEISPGNKKLTALCNRVHGGKFAIPVNSTIDIRHNIFEGNTFISPNSFWPLIKGVIAKNDYNYLLHLTTQRGLYKPADAKELILCENTHGGELSPKGVYDDSIPCPDNII